MASPAFPEPPPSIPPTPLAEVDDAVEQLVARKDAWVKLPIVERVRLLTASMEATEAAASAWVTAACRAKGISAGSQLAGEEWLGGPMTLMRNLRLLVTSLEANGRPDPVRMTKRPDGQYVAQVFPGDLYDKLLFTGFTAEVWIEPGREPSQGKIYREKEAGQFPPGKVSLVLGAGNVASIGPMDVLYKLYAEDEVCILKTNPVNAYLGPYWEASMKPFVDAGFLRIVHGGAEVGIHLCNHPSVDTIHMTGSDKTYDMIVWGATPEEQERRKAAGEPINTRPISSELGCVTPVVVVPGAWSESDLDYHARHVAGMVVNNASFNCNAAKALVVAKGWSLRDRFVSKVREYLAQVPPRKAYYPGAHDRYQGFLEHYPNAVPVGTDSDEVVPWTVIPDVAPSAEEYALSNEAFCGVLAEVDLDASEPEAFLREAVRFCNDECWGTLSMMMLIDPKTEKAHQDAFEQALADLRYGGIAINAWAGVIYGLVVATWGAFPGHPPEDIRSGNGVVHNTYLFDHPQKSIVRAPFRIKPTPAWFANHRSLAVLAERLTRFEAKPGLARLPGVVAAALRG